jgi:predicted choloylglycine hydrolase
MVDIEYLVGVENARDLEGLDLMERSPLLQAPYWPFDGMNERGLAIGMAAVPESELPSNPANPTTGSLEIMRIVLDRAETVPEAIEIFEAYNLDMLGGPWLHYLIADASGEAALIEFNAGQMLVYPNQEGWQHATNFLHSHHTDSFSGVCPRYDRIQATLSSVDGAIDTESALTLLQEVSQDGQASSTQWSVIYNLTDLEILIVMGRDYPQVHRITFESFSP